MTTIMTTIFEDARKQNRYVPSGEWLEEQDYYKFREPTTGLVCHVVRMRSGGNLNGYVELPHGSKYAKQMRKKQQAYWGKHKGKIIMHKQSGYDRLYKHTDVHGGLTFWGNLKSRITHKRVVGFDTAHLNDYCPLYAYTADGYYKNMEYVKEECFNLAKQIGKLHGLVR